MSIVDFVWACGTMEAAYVFSRNSDGSEVFEKFPHDGECRFTKMQRHTLMDFVQLGLTFGWQPRGAAIEDKENDRYRWLYPDEDVVSSYDPIKYCEFKLVGGEDAAAWGEALERAAAAIESGSYEFSPTQGERTFSESMTPGQFFKVNQPANTAHMRDFAQFLKKGPFEFYYDD